MPSTPDIDLSALAEALNEKMDRDMGNHTNTCHYVVETWHSGTNWYRVWSDGWIEQGGRINNYATGTEINLFRSYIDTNYTILAAFKGTGYRNEAISGYPKSTTAFVFYHNASTSSSEMGIHWYACGY